MKIQAIEVAQDPLVPVPDGKGAQQPSWWNQLPLFIIPVLFLLFLLRQSRREKQDKQKLTNNLRKNDKVLTIGGIYGTVLTIADEGDEVSLKIDDNAKIRVTRASILRNITREEESRSPAEKTDK